MGGLFSIARLNWTGEKLVQDFGKGNHSSRKSPLSLVPLTSHKRFQKKKKQKEAFGVLLFIDPTIILAGRKYVAGYLAR